MNLRDQVEQEALAANRAGPSLTDEAVAEALRAAAALVRERREEILGANAADCEGAAGQLDEGTLDRLRLDRARVEAISVQVEATAAIEPLEREVGEWTLANGLRVGERRVPIGAVGANRAPVDRGAAGLLPELLELFRGKGLEVRGDVDGALPLDRPLGHEWASDPERVATVTVATVDGVEEAVRIANEETSALAAGIVTED